jgi:hypothetical protein
MFRREPSCLLQRPAEKELDLRVDTAKIGVRPSLHGFKYSGVEP